jgi:hypothetical protein
MKKPIILFAAVFMLFFTIRCTKDAGELSTSEKSDGLTGLYDGLTGRGGSESGSGSGSGSGTGDSTQQEPVNPGQITAAEWNDLMEWDFWLDLGQNEEFNSAQDRWKFYPGERFSFQVKDSRLNPLIDCEIILKDLQGTELWKARTDNEGKAELWCNLNGGNTGQVAATVKYLDQEVVVADPVAYEDGINQVTMSTEGRQELKADILFVVDATGSMGDEINYLKSELLDVIGRVEEMNAQLDMRLGSVFYRDEGDEYLTRVSSFSSSFGQTLAFIDHQEANGGGDYEEAVHTALNTAITQLSWSENARARLLFLLLDAPPHYTESIVNELHDIIKNTAEKGIKIIPISASGINKDTEFLFRFFATATNGTYVFITNDSGIGGEHIEATVGDYEVELLNDLIVRLINQNTR